MSLTGLRRYQASFLRVDFTYGPRGAQWGARILTDARFREIPTYYDQTPICQITFGEIRQGINPDVNGRFSAAASRPPIAICSYCLFEAAKPGLGHLYVRGAVGPNHPIGSISGVPTGGRTCWGSDDITIYRRRQLGNSLPGGEVYIRTRNISNNGYHSP